MYIKNGFNILGDTSEIRDSKEYKIIAEVITDMIRSNALSFGTGHCVGMSQMIQTALKIRGIKSKLIECRLSICYNSFSPPRIDFIGYDEIANSNEVDTHVVVVTESKIPILIDASISHRLPQDYPVVVQNISNSSSELICEVDHRETAIKMLYEEKKNQRVAIAIQQSLMDRIEADIKILESIQFLKKLNYIGIAMATFAFLNVVGKIFEIF
jgi:hypothetical protein